MDWLLEQQQRAEDSPEVVGSVALTGQGASIATTPIPMPAITEGLYRVSVYARITRAGSVSSSLIVTITHTDGAIACTQVTTALTTNTTASTRVAEYMVRADASTAISYATTYADGGGGTSMQYSLDVRVEALPT